MGLSLNRRHFNAVALSLCLGVVFEARAEKDTKKILVVGDSLSAEYGLKRGTGWVALLEQRLKQNGHGFGVVNASISGDTTLGGRSRLPALLEEHQPRVLIIELGGNDALRGLPLKTSQENLNAMIRSGLEKGAKVLVLGMQMPPNYGPDYAKQMAKMYSDVAQSNRVALVPFFLKGVADIPDAALLFQADRIHPTEAAHPTMLNNVWPALKKLMA
jgi:acyl-CoA thioesterase-1